MMRLSRNDSDGDDSTVRGSPVSWSGEDSGGASTPGDFEWRPPGRLDNRSASLAPLKAHARVSGSPPSSVRSIDPFLPRSTMSTYSRIIVREDNLSLAQILAMFEHDVKLTAEAIRELDVEQWQENADVSDSGNLALGFLRTIRLRPWSPAQLRICRPSSALGFPR